ncbi:aminoacetone oxidase family FAD-binding enzyme [Geothermobacter hydrogeniphilus]|uniref:Aminoacetone oxidase family FAD-binding enzyme n=1 Tax=Geothermobacter hydrogeniphilus TaxID=1969733 RepID=A0A2K2H7L3_9BACT|nr:aminoacetone oxidase family FAD-binding enzyme [Geothermobacter hydrogeniphilus]
MTAVLNCSSPGWPSCLGFCPLTADSGNGASVRKPPANHFSSHDLIVIGGGPAGIFAAGFAALNGARVMLLEKNRRCGAKLLITGKGRCNVTHDEDDPRHFAEAFGRNGKALLTALYAFGPRDVVDFFRQRGLDLKTERGGRVFPARGGAVDVQQILDRFLRDCGVELRTGCEVRRLQVEDGRISGVVTGRGVFRAARYLVATGGLSYPETGCTGDGYAWAEASGHRLVKPEAALMPIRLAEDWTGEWCRLNLKNIRIVVLLDGSPLDERFGEAFFTRTGIGGPIILDMSSAIREALTKGKVSLEVDFKPAVSEELFDKRLQRELADHANRDFRNALGKLLPRDMIPRFILLSGIDPGKKCHSVTRAERRGLLELFKRLPLRVTGHEGMKKAIVTSGGVSLKDVDMRSLRSKKIENLYFAGEMLDIDGPTGGFNLQVCWSTGYLAGVSAARMES